MRTVVSAPGTGQYTQEVGRAFLEHAALDVYVTSFAYHPESRLARMLGKIPSSLAQKLTREFERRSVTLLPHDLVRTFPFWEIARTAASRAGAGPVLIDRLWDRSAHNLDDHVARKYVPKTAAVYAYEYSARKTFDRARREGVASILDLPSLDSRAFEALQRAERERFPELKSASDAYFARKFDIRQKRREEEVRLANVIVTNSNLNKRSHVQAGAEPSKIFVVPLGAPPAISSVAMPLDRNRPLEVVWAGSFIIRKGAHYFLEAWRQLNPGKAARASVYGSVALPETALRPLPDGVVFHGSVAQLQLLAALQAADVLIFPTLSDGFGLVVTEAFSQGLPVITTEAAGAAELVRAGENGLIVRAADATALAEALRWCLDNRDKLHTMRYAALNTAKSWQWSDYRRTLISTLETALRSTGFSPSFTSPAALAAQ